MIFYVAPHDKRSRPVTEADLPTVKEYAPTMRNMCGLPLGRTAGAHAIAHCQVNDTDPLTFFVLREGNIVINPEVVRHTKYPQLKEEGCTSFPMEPPLHVGRFNKLEVKFWSLDEDGNMTGPHEETVRGLTAQVFQHEMAHFSNRLPYSAEAVERQRNMHETIMESVRTQTDAAEEHNKKLSEIHE